MENLKEHQTYLLIEAAEQLSMLEELQEKLKGYIFSLRNSISEKNFNDIKEATVNLTPLTAHLDFSGLYKGEYYSVLDNLKTVTELYHSEFTKSVDKENTIFPLLNENLEKGLKIAKLNRDKIINKFCTMIKYGM